MTRCFRLFCCATGALAALGVAGCGSMSRLASSRSTSGSGTSASAPGTIGSFIAAVDVKHGTITFRSDKASTAGKARVAAQQFGPGDRLTLSGTASYSGSVLSGNVQLTSSNLTPLNDVRVVVTSISDSSVTIANPDGQTPLGGSAGSQQPYWDYVSLDPNVPSTKLWSFNNPGAVNFTFRVTVFANVWTYSVGDANNDTAVSFPDPLHGWIVGQGGKVLATNDGGVTWQAQNAGVDPGVQLEGVSFANQYNGWIVGTGGTIRRTGDGGRTWYSQTTSGFDLTQYNLHAVRFVDPATGWIVGDGGLILKTVDSGTTWTRQGSPGDHVLYGVDFADASNGWVVGQSGTILHTTNGGASWSFQTVPNFTGLLQGVTALNATHAWVCGGNGQILYTTNGNSWLPGNSGTNSSPVTSIFFINSTTGWAVAGGQILRSTDGGVTWAQGSNFGVSAVRFADANNGWAVGANGTIVHSTDGGQTWTVRQQALSVTYNGVSFPDRNHGWMVGGISNPAEGLIRVTSDGGQNWSLQASGTSNILYGVIFKDAENGWVVGQGGTILHTPDGGGTWIPQNSGTNATLVGVDFIDTNHGCVVGGGGTILYTADGGNTWVPMLNPAATNLSSVSMVDGGTVFAVGSSGTILVTINAYDGSQANWLQEFQNFTDDLTTIRMLDANTGWAVGANGRILHTIDGATWDSQASNPGTTTDHATNTLWGADFARIPLPTPNGSPQQYKYVGWAVGDGGRVLRTTNGGATWTPVNAGTINSLRAFRFTDPDSGWAVGTFGTVQHLN